MSEDKKNSLEENFEELEAMIEQLEQGELPLEDAFTIYEAGMKKLRECNDSIEQVEKKMLVLSEQGELEEF